MNAGGQAHPEWLTPDYPERRAGPPWVMHEMVLAERGLPRGIIGHAAAFEIAAAIRAALAQDAGVIVTGCGTSEHAARAVAALVSDALGAAGSGRVLARQAFEAALAPERGVCIGISHEGETAATVAALLAGRRAGATTCLITATGSSDARDVADLVFPTPLEDASWCHTVGYLSPVLAGVAIAAALGAGPFEPDELTMLLEQIDLAVAAGAVRLGALVGKERVVAVGSGIDLITAAEQALKLEEGSWIPATPLHLETLLHGHLPAMDAHTGLIAYLLDPHASTQRAARMRQALRAARAVGVEALLVASDGYAELLGPDGPEGSRFFVPAGGAVGALLAGAVSLQRTTLAFAAARGTNPDLLRRDDVRYRTAARFADSALDAPRETG